MKTWTVTRLGFLSSVKDCVNDWLTANNVSASISCIPYIVSGEAGSSVSLFSLLFCWWGGGRWIYFPYYFIVDWSLLFFYSVLVCTPSCVTELKGCFFYSDPHEDLLWKANIVKIISWLHSILNWLELVLDVHNVSYSLVILYFISEIAEYMNWLCIIHLQHNSQYSYQPLNHSTQI